MDSGAHYWLGAHMGDWGFFDWLAYGTTWIAAIVIAASGAIRIKSTLRRKIPQFMKWPFWSFVPILLLVIGFLAFWLMPMHKSCKDVMIDYGSSLTVIFHRDTNTVTPPDPWSYIIADGPALSYLNSDKFKLLGVAFHIAPNVDKYDTSNLSKSGLFDIRPENIVMRIYWNATFVNEAMEGARGTDYTLLAVPLGVTPDKFDTLHQATALGAKIIEERGGPP